MHGRKFNRTYTTAGAVVYAKLPFDVASANLPIVSGIGMRIQMTKADSKFTVMCQDEAEAMEKGYRLEVMDAQLLILVRKYNVGIQLDLEKQLKDKACWIPLQSHSSEKIIHRQGLAGLEHGKCQRC